MSGFNMGDYVDVSERIRQFAKKFPEGSLQSELEFVNGGWLCKAYAYRSADDARPGIGHAFEPVPGKTPYTRDSEAMNAETSAWGRAIVALGFETKKIASANEVRARQGSGEPAADSGEAAATAPWKPAQPQGAGHQPTGAAAVPSPDNDPHGLKASRADAPSSQFRAPNLNGEATDKQKNYVKALCRKLGLTDEQITENIGVIESMTKQRAAEVIEKLQKLEKNRAAA